ncbi:hypothetical protein ABZ568_00355 [Streptomyces olindensis]|uniref:Uncharacterized protein n=1 Tax=Streptomyces olindensis TaxID=358823 RepID=A0ABV2XLN5_9ACTN
MASCKCGGSACNCVVLEGPGTTVTGAGTTTNPITVGAKVSPAPGNTLTIDSDGLFVPAPSPPVPGCGLAGSGTAEDPLIADVKAWPYACDIAANGGVVACDPVTGQLYSEPRTQTGYQNYFDTRFYPSVVVPAGNNLITPADTFTTTVTNPDPCRSARLFIAREVDVYFTLPPGSTAAYGQESEEMWFTFNNGSTTIIDSHLQSTRWLQYQATVPAGGSVTITSDVRVGKGTGGAVYTQIQYILRTLFITR